jgi:hypothetical protein
MMEKIIPGLSLVRTTRISDIVVILFLCIALLFNSFKVIAISLNFALQKENDPFPPEVCISCSLWVGNTRSVSFIGQLTHLIPLRPCLVLEF